ncbi:hypothetical protein KFL_000510290 [Klebsormidium nitens]|uniref:Uncharacterized protein n=1 Tax=Klebsormidium nitens TaxID=105231 RepID=A0A1Y1HWV6_KLENI|nr:hypothetical protein KFL_000510290 [Klebsormidium nitens]|eukprot:GAQ80328.1 hypothetical protein KFL_000510290 [Klebsormidium nitens]
MFALAQHPGPLLLQTGEVPGAREGEGQQVVPPQLDPDAQQRLAMGLAQLVPAAQHAVPHSWLVGQQADGKVFESQIPGKLQHELPHKVCPGSLQQTFVVAPKRVPVMQDCPSEQHVALLPVPQTRALGQHVALLPVPTHVLPAGQHVGPQHVSADEEQHDPPQHFPDVQHAAPAYTLVLVMMLQHTLAGVAYWARAPMPKRMKRTIVGGKEVISDSGAGVLVAK